MTNVLELLGDLSGVGNVRFQVLAYLLENPQGEVYPSGLALKIHLPEASVRRALDFLTLREILIKRPTRYRNFFRLQPSFTKKFGPPSHGHSSIPAAKIHGRYD